MRFPCIAPPSAYGESIVAGRTNTILPALGMQIFNFSLRLFAIAARPDIFSMFPLFCIYAIIMNTRTFILINSGENLCFKQATRLAWQLESVRRRFTSSCKNEKFKKLFKRRRHYLLINFHVPGRLRLNFMIRVNI